VYAAAAYVSAGNKAEAAWQAEEIRALQPGFATRTWRATHPLTDVKMQARLVQRFTASLSPLHSFTVHYSLFTVQPFIVHRFKTPLSGSSLAPCAKNRT